ncbi:hypothetical protein GIY62_06290 [Burkholderia plantarii]|uniref:hypothetical protein n=1 Tax=Burkholderia plantarii TaxID=41899 RepID=UPI002729D864|nr:hypothetical protein [Burkholderia plantarii]WLE60267.1 hypothetical protein GIY62_06290 [Burkholderia plantarii]
MHSQPVRFFWIGERSEIFAAVSFQQLLDDAGQCGSGIEFVDAGTPFDRDGEPIEYGELDGNTHRLTVMERDSADRPLGYLTGSLHDIYARVDGGRFKLPSMLLTWYF